MFITSHPTQPLPQFRQHWQIVDPPGESASTSIDAPFDVTAGRDDRKVEKPIRPSSGWNPVKSMTAMADKLERLFSRHPVNEKMVRHPAQGSSSRTTTEGIARSLGHDTDQYMTPEEVQLVRSGRLLPMKKHATPATRSKPEDGKAFFTRKQPQVKASHESLVDLDMKDRKGLESVLQDVALVPKELASIVTGYAELTEKQAWAFSKRMPPPIDVNHAQSQLMEDFDKGGDVPRVNRVQSGGRTYDLPPGSEAVDIELFENGPIALLPRREGIQPVVATVFSAGLQGMIVFSREEPPPGVAFSGPLGPVLIQVEGGFIWCLDTASDAVRRDYVAWKMDEDEGDWLDPAAAVHEDELFDTAPMEDMNRPEDPAARGSAESVKGTREWREDALAQLAELASEELGAVLCRQHAQAYGMDPKSVGDPRMLIESFHMRKYSVKDVEFTAPRKYWKAGASSAGLRGQFLLVNTSGHQGPAWGRARTLASEKTGGVRMPRLIVGSYKPLDLKGASEPLRAGNVWIQEVRGQDMVRCILFSDVTEDPDIDVDPDFAHFKGMSFEDLSAVFALRSALPTLFRVLPGRSSNLVLDALVEQGKTFAKRLRSQIEAMTKPGEFHTLGIERVLCHEEAHATDSGITARVFKPKNEHELPSVSPWLFENCAAIEHVAPGTAMLSASASDAAKAAYARGGFIYTVSAK